MYTHKASYKYQFYKIRWKLCKDTHLLDSLWNSPRAPLSLLYFAKCSESNSMYRNEEQRAIHLKVFLNVPTATYEVLLPERPNIAPLFMLGRLRPA